MSKRRGDDLRGWEIRAIAGIDTPRRVAGEPGPIRRVLIPSCLCRPRTHERRWRQRTKRRALSIGRVPRSPRREEPCGD